MTQWNPEYQEVDGIKSFEEVAEDRGYTIGENAGDMAVGQYQQENVFLELQDSEEASYNLLADLIGDQLSSYGVRTPSVSYDEEAVLEELDSDKEGVMISEELGTGMPISGGDKPEVYAESLVNTFAFEALMGQGDIPENTEADSEGFYAFDFGNSGGNIKGVYEAIKGEARDMAEELGIDSEIDDYDRIGITAVEMANDLDLDELDSAVSRREIDDNAYEKIRRNFRVAREASHSEKDISKYFSPETPDQDEGVELL